MKQNIRLRLLSNVVIAYLILAFAWWSVLLFVKNRDAFLAKRELLRIGMIAEDRIHSNEEFLQQPAYRKLFRQYRMQEWMILGEGGVFMISLVIGVWLINRGYNKEMGAARQSRNFLLSITHELKSPLASIRLVLETFQRLQLTREQIDKLTGNGLKEVERLNSLVDDLLLSAKLESTYQLHREPVDLVELLAELMEKLEHKHPEARFRFHCPSPVPPVNGDKTGLTSVALNLLENAIKYAADTPEIDVTIQHQHGRIHLEIADQGIGIADKEKKRIFGKFYRVGSEDTRKTKGTGLGLYIVDQIVHAHHGTINVRDNQPRGSVFMIDLPVG